LDHPNIELFNEDLSNSSAGRLQCVIKELTLDTESLEKAKLHGNKLLPIDEELWRAIYNPEESLSQLTQDSFSQLSQGISLPDDKVDNMGPKFSFQRNNKPEEDEENEGDAEDEEDDQEEEEEEEEEEDDEEEDEEGEESEEGRPANAFEERFRKAKAEERAAEKTAVNLDDESMDTSQGDSVYDDDSVVWFGSDGETLDHDVEVVKTSLSQMKKTRTKWTRVKYFMRDESFYNDTVGKTLVNATTKLMQETKLPKQSFNKWKDHKKYFIQGDFMFPILVS